ncbi:MAG: flagellar basal-body rod modification protein FlgD [Pseudohongiellaceae bacterium]|jgi:flagellar basal-body rod modification protein FlgD
MIDSTVSTGLLGELSIANKQQASGVEKDNELGQDAFLKLMIAQMNNQDPLEPQKNSEFVAQLAQFSSVEGLDKLNGTVETMSQSFQSSQALQASSLVGRSVKVPSETATLDTGGHIAGTINLPYSTGDLSLGIYSDTGQLVGKELLGSHEGGDVTFVWDGRDNDGNTLPSGKYRFEAIANTSEGPQQLATDLSANVDSVTVGGNGTLTLNISGIGPMSLSSVSEIL